MYKVSFYVSLCEEEVGYPAAAISSIGAYLSKDTFVQDNKWFLEYGFIPQIKNPLNRFLDDTLGWMKVSGVMKAAGGEKLILISNFLSDSLTPSKPIYGKEKWQGDYFLDDVSVEPLHFPDLGKDTILCAGNTMILKPGGTEPDSVFWQNGSRSDSFIARKPGTYWVKVYHGTGYFTDTILINNYEINLGADKILCKGENYTFTLPQDGTKYEWPGGSTNNTFTVNQSGKYWVKALKDGCTAYDTAEIVFQQPLSTYTLPKDTILCDIAGKELDIYGDALTGRSVINMQGLEKGIYIVKIFGSNGKILKNEKVFIY